MLGNSWRHEHQAQNTGEHDFAGGSHVFPLEADREIGATFP
jgi:hypothetical protein